MYIKRMKMKIDASDVERFINETHVTYAIDSGRQLTIKLSDGTFAVAASNGTKTFALLDDAVEYFNAG